MRRRATPFLLLLPALACLAPPPLHAQAPAGSVQLLESTDAVCTDPEVRRKRSSARESFCIVGLARHPGGVARVLMNGASTTLRPQEGGDIHFVGFVPTETAQSGLELIVYPTAGQPVVQGYALVRTPADSTGAAQEFWSRKNPLASRRRSRWRWPRGSGRTITSP